MVLCQIQKTHEKLKSENKNLLKTNCSHLLCSSEGNVTVEETEHVKQEEEEWWALRLHLPHSQKCLPVKILFLEDLWLFVFVVVLFLFCFFFKVTKMSSQREFVQGFCCTTEWGFVACVQLCLYRLTDGVLSVLHLTWNKMFLTKGQISEWKSRREFWSWCGIHLRALSWIQKKQLKSWSALS